jgi:hypothetical protein
MKDNLFVKAEDVPEDIKEILEAKKGTQNFIEGVDIKTMSIKNDPVYCIFCHKPAECTRMVNMQTVALCRSDYYANNIGKVSARVRELNHGIQGQEKKEQEILG